MAAPRRSRPTSNFNPRSPHGERHAVRPPHARHDGFQPTLPARGATHVPSQLEEIIMISTHAPRTGSDTSALSIVAGQLHFNPRSPHGERLTLSSTLLVLFSISTHAPRTGSDPFRNPRHFRLCISTHAPRTGSDVGLYTIVVGVLDFNPRSPHGERHVS